MGPKLQFRGSGNELGFTKWLARLKEQGANILVTGEVLAEVSAQASRVLFGRTGPRYRILGLTDRTITDGTARLPEGVESDWKTWVVDQRCNERSAPATAETVVSGLDPVESDDFQQLCDEIQAAIGVYEEEADGLQPAQIRVGIDSLRPPLEADFDGTKHALRSLCATVRGVSGMAHYHLRVSPDDDIVDELMPIFDVRVELRNRPQLNPEQRWYAPDLDVETDWVEL